MRGIAAIVFFGIVIELAATVFGSFLEIQETTSGVSSFLTKTIAVGKDAVLRQRAVFTKNKVLVRR